MSKKENEEIVRLIKAQRFGWVDFILNTSFSIIMITTIYIVIALSQPETLTDWILAMITTILPLLFFANRAFNELFYTKDYVKITNEMMYFRSTPLLTTGLRPKTREIPIREIKKYGVSKIPRKLSIDMFKLKRKAMLVLVLKSGENVVLGGYIDNQKLFEIVAVIQQIYPKARLSKPSLTAYPELNDILKVAKPSKKLKQIKDDEVELDSVEVRRRR
ncbi:MAG: hypothetical protein KAS95_01150 [Candidatus Heimdallarchaeota archaeon]|nr:hypothetical protein [Candidatus Heimdallarchaeota archaeon]